MHSSQYGTEISAATVVLMVWKGGSFEVACRVQGIKTVKSTYVGVPLHCSRIKLAIQQNP